MIESDWEARLEALRHEFPDAPSNVLETMANDPEYTIEVAQPEPEPEPERPPNRTGRVPRGGSRKAPTKCPFCPKVMTAKGLAAHITNVHPGAREAMLEAYGSAILPAAWWLDDELIEAGRAGIRPRPPGAGKPGRKLKRKPTAAQAIVDEPKPKATKRPNEGALLGAFLEAVYGKTVVPIDDLPAITEWTRATLVFLDAVTR